MPPSPAGLSGPSFGPVMNPSSDIAMFRIRRDMSSPSLGGLLTLHTWGRWRLERIEQLPARRRPAASGEERPVGRGMIVAAAALIHAAAEQGPWTEPGQP